MFYTAVRAWAGWVLRLFYKIELVGEDPAPAGGVIYVGNHPNGLIDPGLLLAYTKRRLTALAKAPLFKMPVLSWLLKALDALPVYRTKDHASPDELRRNKDTVDQSVRALAGGRAILLFPEGRSHSEPALGELKSGAARMALAASELGQPIRIVPVGLMYAEKHKFRSEVRVTFTEPIVVDARPEGSTTPQQVRELTEQIATALRKVTLNLTQWEDLPLLETAEELYAMRAGTPAADPERLRAFAQGVQVLREQSPEELEALRGRLASFRRRMAIVRATPSHLEVRYSPGVVTRFTVRNLLALITGLPLAALGFIVFTVPYFFPQLVTKLGKPELDTEGTVKILAAIFIAPIWGVVIGWTVWHFAGPWWALAAVVAALPLALFTRYFLERRAEAVRDARAFFILVGRRDLRQHLRREAEELSLRIEHAAEVVRAVAPEAVEAR